MTWSWLMTVSNQRAFVLLSAKCQFAVCITIIPSSFVDGAEFAGRVTVSVRIDHREQVSICQFCIEFLCTHALLALQSGHWCWTCMCWASPQMTYSTSNTRHLVLLIHGLFCSLRANSICPLNYPTITQCTTIYFRGRAPSYEAAEKRAGLGHRMIHGLIAAESKRESLQVR